MQTEKTKPATAGATGTQQRAGLADAAKDAARREMDDARERLHGAAGKVRQEASRAGSSVTKLMMDEIDKRKGAFSEGLQGVADAMRKAADDIDANEQTPATPRMVLQAVNTIEDVAERLRYQSSEDIGRTLSRYGRENPTLFIAGALLTGLAVGRFLVSTGSGESRPGRWEDDRNGDDRSTADYRRSGGSGYPATGGTSSGAAGYGNEQHDLPSGTGTGSGSGRVGGYGMSSGSDMASGSGSGGSTAGPAAGSASVAGSAGTDRDPKQGSTSQPTEGSTGGPTNPGAGPAPVGPKQGRTGSGDDNGTV